VDWFSELKNKLLIKKLRSLESVLIFETKAKVLKLNSFRVLRIWPDK